MLATLQNLADRLWYPPLDDAARKNAPGEFVKVMGEWTHYRRQGDPQKPWVVMVTGFSTPLFCWQSMQEEIAAKGYHTVSYDLFGRGYSARPEDRDYTPAFFAEQLQGLLLALGAPKTVHIVAWSMGAIISTEFCLQNPTKVASLSLIAPGGLPVPIPLTGKLIRFPILGELLVATIGRRTMKNGSPDNFADPAPLDEYMREYKKQLRYRGFGRAILSTVRHMPLGDLRDGYRRYAKLNIPTLLLWGDADKVCPYENHDAYKALVPHTRFVPFPGAGHAVLLEQPRRVNTVIADFLKASQSYE